MTILLKEFNFGFGIWDSAVDFGDFCPTLSQDGTKTGQIWAANTPYLFNNLSGLSRLVPPLGQLFCLGQ
jgi:hypothetical protein